MATDTRHELDAFVATWEREFEITKRVLENVPADREDWKPVANARSLRDLVWIFVTIEQVLDHLGTGAQFTTPPQAPDAPVRELVKQYEEAHRAAREAVRAAGGQRMDAKIPFPTGPGKMDEVQVGQSYWLFLHDMIHHRGQLSVYLRLLGAKVPSIYGGSLDEPWR
jgi:uncharacterized damage-inducible protein DinB